MILSANPKKLPEEQMMSADILDEPSTKKQKLSSPSGKYCALILPSSFVSRFCKDMLESTNLC